jgi:hypothetical protein
LSLPLRCKTALSLREGKKIEDKREEKGSEDKFANRVAEVSRFNLAQTSLKLSLVVWFIRKNRSESFSLLHHSHDLSAGKLHGKIREWKEKKHLL